MTLHSAPQILRKTLRLLIVAAAIIAGAPVFSGASLYAQTNPDTDLTSLIRSVNEQSDSTAKPSAIVQHPDTTAKPSAFSRKAVRPATSSALHPQEDSISLSSALILQRRRSSLSTHSPQQADSTALDLVHLVNQQPDKLIINPLITHSKVEGSSGSPLPVLDDDAVAGNILDRLILEASRNPKDEKLASSASVLDFMTKVYADHSFYQTGHWDDAEDWSAITRNIRLPEYDPADFYRPVWGRVTSSYGFRPSFGRLHKGIDLALNVGDTVRAALPGVVAKVSYDPGGYGHYVVVVHNNGMETRYAHLQSAITTLGQTVFAGQPLGLGGNSGNSTGPHLHFEVRYRGTALDPASLFNFTPRRPPSSP